MHPKAQMTRKGRTTYFASIVRMVCQSDRILEHSSGHSGKLLAAESNGALNVGALIIRIGLQGIILL